MALDPTKHADWEIAEDSETRMKPIAEIAAKMGLKPEELLPHGHHIAKVDFKKVLARLKDRRDGKSTSTIGLTQGMGKRGKNVIATIRQPSGGPTMNIKGSAAGGGLSQVIPLTPFSLGLTGDINAIMNAHNLAMVALTSRMQHEFNYNDKELAERNLKRLDIDPDRVELKWIMDFCAQSLREIIIGMGGKMNGFMMKSGFAIAVSSELMAILFVVKDR